MINTHRPRRLRATERLRKLVRETHVSRTDLIYPVFVWDGDTQPIGSMPGISRFSIDDLCREAETCAELGLPGLILFGIPETKDEVGSGAYADDGIVSRAVKALRSVVGESLLLIADVCLCEYTSHGHCGVLHEGHVINDESLPLLARASVAYAQAGADIVAPSDMMDGRVAAIRQALDEEGLLDTPILAYSAKYASAFYGPFREAAESTPQTGDRRGYQMDPANRREAIREIELDLQEGADIIMIKPALPYLDIIRDAREAFNTPLAAYNVSGEYAMMSR